MHILLVADGRSPITRRWTEAIMGGGYTVSLISTFPSQPLPGLEHFAVLPVAFSRYARQAGTADSPAAQAPASAVRRAIKRFRGLFLAGRYVLGPLSLLRYGAPFRQYISAWQPDLVHALRIPFEGMLASRAPASIPLVLSIWGNDLTLHAHGSPWMRSETIRALRRATALMADARRDLRLARLWGLPGDAPVLAVPGSGGLPLEEIQSTQGDPWEDLGFSLPDKAPVVINPRGFRPGSVRNDTFFRSIPRILEQHPSTVFLCAAMAGMPEALGWLDTLGPDCARQVHLLPSLPQERLWRLFHRAQVMVSPSQHDGTPNSLLESMACGAFPVAGDIESIREWITPGVNGLVVDPADPEALAGAVSLALEDPDLRNRAAARSARLLQERASREAVRAHIQNFYTRVLEAA